MTTQTVQCTVVGLQTNPVAAGVPALAGAVLTWNGSAWAPGAIAVNIPSLTVTGPSVMGATLQVAGNINPAAGNQYNIGAAAIAWAEGYITNVYGTVTPPSDPRLKKHIHDAPNALAAVNSIPVRTFRFKTDSDDAPLHWGFLTTEVQALMGMQFAGIKTGDDPDKTQYINYGDMTALLWKAVQELTDLVREYRRNALSN